MQSKEVHPLFPRPALRKRLGPEATRVYKETLASLPHLQESEREILRSYALTSSSIQAHELEAARTPLTIVNGDKEVKHPLHVMLASLRRDQSQLYKRLRDAAAENEVASRQTSKKTRTLTPDAESDTGLA